MTIEVFQNTDMLKHTRAHSIVNPVNCVGVMGAGMALWFKNKYPDNFATYVVACRGQQLKPGGLLPYKIQDRNKWILNLATKDHWRNPSKIEYIEKGMDTMAIWCEENAIKSIACPAIGCGKGGLDWDDVRVLAQQRFASTAVHLELYEPIELAPKNKFKP